MNLLIAIDHWLDNLPYRRRRRIKQELRAVLSQKRRMLTAEQVAKASSDIVQQILLLPEFVKAKRIMMYYPIHNEIDLRELITLAPDKQFFLPVTHHKSIEVRAYDAQTEMKRGKYGIPEPQTDTYKGKLDLILVPGVAFDKEGHRMGRGGGYYDRFLRRFCRTPKIGVAYRFQRVKRVPTTWNDIKMDKLIINK